MKHLGDITKISGYSVPITDCVIGGSPCQDLSVAGRREGLQGERSGLFMEQIRLIKEMRENDARSGKPNHLLRPRFMLWENVPGAFSSAKGEDFKAVLEETIKIAEPNAPSIPLPPKGKWPMADCWFGDTWSIAYRVLDAQFWGVPQRRRRIALVADFGGHAAPEILFVRKSLCGDFAEGEEQRQENTAGTGAGTPETVFCIQGNCIDRADTAGCNGKGWTEDVSYTLNTIDRPAVAAIHMTQDPIISVDKTPCLSSGNPENGQCSIAVFENHGQYCRLTGPLETAPTISQKFGTGGNNTPLVIQKAAGFKPNQGAKAHGIGYQTEVSPTLNTDSLPPAVLQETIEMPLVMATGQANAEICKDLCPTLHCGCERPILAYRFDALSSNSMKSDNPNSGGHFTDICHTLDASLPDPAKNQGGIAIMQSIPIGIGRDAFNQGTNAKFGLTIEQDLQPPLLAKGPGAVETKEIVRRLTPLECERLQGYPDGWTDIGAWTDSKGKLHKEASDGARYKALGNSIALPPWRWVIKRLCGCYERPATMASLFDGIGGFPLIWEQFNGKGSVLWASEIEEFPIAVTKKRFPEEER